MQTSGSSSQSLSFGYNANGDRTSATRGMTPFTYGYNQPDELTSYTSGSTSATYSYNGDGLRAAKTVTGGSTEGYVWDIAEGMPTIMQDGSTRYITGPNGLPIEQVDGSGIIEYYIQDQLGSTRGLLDSAGTVVGSYTFTPYGELKGHSGASTPFGYAGQYTDGESGLQYLRARYYDPSSAQFLTVDPLVGSTTEPYGYAEGNPARWADPSGQLCAGPIPVPWTGDTLRSCMRKSLSGADYASLSVNLVYPPILPPVGPGVTAGLTYTRTGNVYFTFGFGAGTVGASAELRGGHIAGPHSPCDVDSFVSGPSITASGLLPVVGLPGIGGFGPSAGVTWGNPGHYTSSDFSGEAGVGVGTAGGSVMGTWSWKIAHPGPPWRQS